MTDLLSPSEYGRLALGMTVGLLVQQAAFGAPAAASLRFFAHAREEGSVKGYLLALRRLVLAITFALSGLVLIAAIGLTAVGASDWTALLVASSALAVFAGVDACLDSVQTAARQRIVVAFHDGLGAWLRYPVALVLLLILGRTGTVALIGFMVSSVLVLASQLWFFRRRILVLVGKDDATGDAEARQWASRMYRYSWPVATWGAFTWLQMSSDRWALQVFGSTKEVGLYNAVYQIGYLPIAFLSAALVQFVSPIVYAMAGDANDRLRLAAARRLVGRLAWATVGLTVVAGVATLGLRGPITNVLLAPEFRANDDVLPLLVVSGGLFAAGQVAALSVTLHLDMRRLIAPKIVTAFAGVVFNIAGAAIMGTQGVAWASLAFSMTFFGWTSRVAALAPRSPRQLQN